MKIRLSEYEEGVADGREESAEIIRQQQVEIEALKTLLDKGCIDSKSYVIGWDDGKNSRESEIEALEQSKDRLIKTLLDVRGQQPVAFGMTWKDGEIYDVISPAQHAKEEGDYTVPLYTHPHPDNLGLAESIIKQQAEIEALKSKLNKYYLKEDLDKSLNLIYGKEFIK